MPRKTRNQLLEEVESLKAQLTLCENGKGGILAPQKVLYPRNAQSPFARGRARTGHFPIAMRNYSHYDHPGYYKDPWPEYWDLVNRVTFWDVGGAERQVEITGKDAARFVQMLTTRDMTQCKTGAQLAPDDPQNHRLGQCKYSFLTLPHGGIYNDPVINRLEENRFWISLADTDVLPAAQMLHAGLLIAGENLDVHISEPDVAPFQIQGPFSRQVVRDLLGEFPTYTDKDGNNQDIRYYWLKTYFAKDNADLDGIEFVIARTGYSGEIGVEIYVVDATKQYKNTAMTNAEVMWVKAWEAGKTYEASVIGPCHIRRIEAGILALGPTGDMWWDTNPFEVDMGYPWMVDLRNPENNFVGRKALEKVQREGVSRKLVGIDIDNENGDKNFGAFIDSSMPQRFDVYKGRKKIGEVPSACYSPRLGKNIGYAMLEIDYTEIGTEFFVETPLGRLSAMAVQKPHLDPNKEIPKQ